MRKLILIAQIMFPSLALAVLGGGPLGEKCYTKGEQPGGISEECANGLICYYNNDAGYGTCMSDCVAIEQTTKISLQMYNGLGFESKIIGDATYLSANCVTCSDYLSCPQVNTRYRCGITSYGHSTDGETGCTRCPGVGVSNTTGSLLGGTKITDCHLLANSTHTDASGTFTVSDVCYYTE